MGPCIGSESLSGLATGRQSLFVVCRQRHGKAILLEKGFTMYRRTLLSLGLFGAILIPGATLLQAAEDQRQVDLIAGFDAVSRIKDNLEFQQKRRHTFADQKVVFFENSLERDRMTRVLERADIFWFSGHSGVPKKLKNVQVLEVKPRTSSEVPYLLPDEIRQALKGRTGPRLVVLNGCITTDPNDGVPGPNRLSTAFGITDGTHGRAYLGWSKEIPGMLADDQVGRVLDIWTAPKPNGSYPTLEEARQKAGVQNLKIIGDSELRYKELYRLSVDPKTPGIPVLWEVISDKSARLTLDFTGFASQLAELKKMGISIEPKIVLHAQREGDGYVIRDPALDRLLAEAGKVAAILGAAFDGWAGGEAKHVPVIKIDLRDVSAKVKLLDKDKLEIQMDLQVKSITVDGKSIGDAGKLKERSLQKLVGTLVK